MIKLRAPLLLTSILFFPIRAVTQDTSGPAEIATEAIRLAETYLAEAESRDLTSYPTDYQRGLKEFRNAVSSFSHVLKPLAIEERRLSEQSFRSRYSRRARGANFELDVSSSVDAIAKAGVSQFNIDEDVNGVKMILCCRLRVDASTERERKLSDGLVASYNKLDKRYLERTLAENKVALRRFESKLLDGFPAMPWEYIWNFRGDRHGPSANQLIWLHPSVGLEARTNHVPAGANRVHTVLTLQPLGGNLYIREGPVNYVGLAALLTLNTVQGADRFRYGGLVHLGNMASFGATYGDNEWVLFIASDRVFDLPALFFSGS